MAMKVNKNTFFMLCIILFGNQQLWPVPMQAPQYDAKKDAFISTFFIKAQERIPLLEQFIKTMKADTPEQKKELAAAQNTLDFYTILTLIWNRDIKGLKKIDAKKMGGITADIVLQEEDFSPEAIASLGLPDPRLFMGAAIGSEDILPYLFLSSVRDKTLPDKRSTLAMIDMVLGKRETLDMRDIILAQAFFIRKKVGDAAAPDYIGTMPLMKVVVDFSYPEAVEKVIKRIDYIYNNKADQVVADYQQKGLDLEKIFGATLVSTDPALQALFKKYHSAFLLAPMNRKMCTAVQRAHPEDLRKIQNVHDLEMYVIVGKTSLK